jgi:hypothetical protein
VWRRIDKGWRDSYCRPCRSAYKKEHYAKNKQRYIDQNSARNREVTEERMHYLVDYLEEHPCVDCGERDVAVLDFDHLGHKEFHVSYGIRSRNWESVLREIAKCEVVCGNCHRRRTARRGGFFRMSAVEGRLPGL